MEFELHFEMTDEMIEFPVGALALAVQRVNTQMLRGEVEGEILNANGTTIGFWKMETAR